MKAASGGMITLVGELGGAQTAFVAELVTITLKDGTVLRYTTAPVDLTVSPYTFSSAGPYPIVGPIGWKLGIEVGVAKLQLWSLLTNVVESVAVLQAVVEGLFDNALVVVERIFMSTWGDTSNGTIVIFKGNVSDVTEADALHVELDVKSRKELLNIPLPYRTYQPACRWTLYGPGCQLTAAGFQVSGAVTSGSGQVLLNTNLTNPDHYFDEGYITFLTGPNSGFTRAIRQHVHAGGQILLFVPLPNAVLTGDTFLIFPGCDKQQATCSSKFSNLGNFGGMPYIPIPETSV